MNKGFQPDTVMTHCPLFRRVTVSVSLDTATRCGTVKKKTLCQVKCLPGLGFKPFDTLHSDFSCLKPLKVFFKLSCTMPMDRKRYPKDWDAIALAIKEAANWTCQDCGKPCRRPGEALDELCFRIERTDFVYDLYRHEEDEEFGAHEAIIPGRFVLTVAHLNHIPEDCRPENLRALCAPCHCRMDLKAMSTKRRLKAEYQGQLTLGI